MVVRVGFPKFPALAKFRSTPTLFEVPAPNAVEVIKNGNTVTTITRDIGAIHLN